MGKWNKYNDIIVSKLKGGESISPANLAAELIGIQDYSNKDFQSLRTHIWRTLHKSTKKNEKVDITMRKWEQDESSGKAQLEQGVSEPVKSLDDLIRICNIDLSVWSIDRWVCNTWGVTSFKKSSDGKYSTNYQVKAWLSKKEKTVEEIMSDLISSINIDRIEINKKKGNGVGVVSLADLHIGASIKNLIKTPDFDINILIKYLSRAADIVNSRKYKEVHINLLGDFFESLSGVNHENTFKSLGEGMWGANPIIFANEIIGKHLLGRINNLASVNMVSGNHDRMTASNKVDNTGEGGKILWYILQKDFPNIPIRYHNSVLKVEIDGINYLLTHGDKGYSKKEFSKFVLDYGDTGIYNLVLEGHLHTYLAKKTIRSVLTKYDDIEYISMDEVNYRKIVVPSIFTGNWFSESLGFTSAAGIIISENNGNGNPNIFNYTL